MSLKVKLVLIIAGIAFIPPLSVLIQFASQLDGSRDITPLFLSLKALSSHLDEAVATGDFGSFSEMPKGASLAVVGEDGTVLFAGPGAEELPALISPGASDRPAAGFSSAAALDYHILSFSSGAVRGRAILSVPSEKTIRLLNPAAPLPLTLIVLLLFVSVLAILIVRHLGVSIRRLEASMARIAAGDLDFIGGAEELGDLSPLGRSLDTMRRQLKEDRERRDRFIMGVSHDLKTPLAVIQGYLEALRDGLADTEEKRADFLEILTANSELLEARIAHLIQLAKITTENWRATLVERDFGAELEELLGNLADYCAVRGRSLERDIRLDPPCLLPFDPDMVSRVFENLVDNAVRYGAPDLPVRVAAYRSGPAELAVLVSNGGPAIPEADLAKLFEPFFRGDRGRQDGGFGLGLASVKSIVETHGWNVTVRSSRSEGTVFTIAIPLR